MRSNLTDRLYESVAGLGGASRFRNDDCDLSISDFVSENTTLDSEVDIACAIVEYFSFEDGKYNGNKMGLALCTKFMSLNFSMAPSEVQLAATDLIESAKAGMDEAVSYTHLTLPTNREV